MNFSLMSTNSRSCQSTVSYVINGPIAPHLFRNMSTHIFADVILLKYDECIDTPGQVHLAVPVVQALLCRLQAHLPCVLAKALLQVWTSATSATVEQDGTESGTVRTNVSTARDRHDIGTFDGEACHASRSKSRIPTKEAEGNRVIRRRRCRQKTRPPTADGASLLAPRGCPQHDPTRHKFRPLRPNANRRCDAVHCTIFACSGSSMEASKRVQRRQHPSSQCSPPDDDRGTAQESGRDQNHEAGGRELQEADCGEHPGRERLLPLSAMESRAGETHQRQVSPSTHTGRGHGSDQHDYQGDGGPTQSLAFTVLDH